MSGPQERKGLPEGKSCGSGAPWAPPLLLVEAKMMGWRSGGLGHLQ